jgi:hypothetical protein
MAEESQSRRLQELRSIVDEVGNEPPALSSIISRFARNALDRELRPFQLDGIAYLLNGAKTDKVLAMIQPPGAGKSLCYIIAGCMSRGVTIIMEPTLTLSADQLSKLRVVNDAARVTAFNLDAYKTEATWSPVEKVLRSLLELPSQCVPSVFLVVSPQRSSDKKKPWRQLFLDFAKAGLLRLMVLDELHLVREQGETLRPEFKTAGKTVLAEIKKISPKTPLALFTGTCQLMDLSLVESICSSKISRIIWASPREFQKRGIKISLVCRSSYASVAKQIVPPILDDPRKKMVAYTDFEVNVESTADAIRGVAEKDSSDRPFDCLEITGTDQTEEKALNTNIFCENLTTEEGKEASSLYRALVATSGAASTGIDPPNVVLVSRRGCPPSLGVMFQELGRLLRNEPVQGWDYLYHMMIDVNSYAGLVWRTETSKNATRSEKDRNLTDHLQALKAIVLDRECLPFTLETTFGRPGSTDTMPASCQGRCPLCSGERDGESALFDVTALQRSLYNIFSGVSTSVKLGTTQNSDNFVSQLKKVGLDEGVWLDSRNMNAASTVARTSIDTHNVEMLVLQLIAAEIIEAVTTTEKGVDGESTTVVCVCGASNDSGTAFLFSDPTVFNVIPKARM